MNNIHKKSLDILVKIILVLYKTFFFTFFIFAVIKLIVNDGNWVNYFIISILGFFLLYVYKVIRGRFS